jgi:transcription antitermination factor NusG
MYRSRILDLGESASAPTVVGATDQKGWQLVYTVARHEKAVAAQLLSRGIDNYLPLYKTTHLWHKRSVNLELPLFPSYVFIHLDGSNRRNVVTVPGVVSIVSFQGRPAVVPEEQIAAVQNALKFRHVHPCPYLASGNRVRIMSGPLSGIVGVIDRVKGFRVIVSVDSITSSIAIEAGVAELELAG